MKRLGSIWAVTLLACGGTGGPQAAPAPAPQADYEGVARRHMQLREQLERPVKMRFERDPGETQFRRHNIRREVDREFRDARWESLSDIGAA